MLNSKWACIHQYRIQWEPATIVFDPKMLEVICVNTNAVTDKQTLMQRVQSQIYNIS